jgi:capsid portal protein
VPAVIDLLLKANAFLKGKEKFSKYTYLCAHTHTVTWDLTCQKYGTSMNIQNERYFRKEIVFMI